MKKAISITRALVELKTLQDRINRATYEGIFVSRVQGSGNYRKVVGSANTPEQAEALIKASFESVESLIARRQVIKSAIVLSNASANVEIMGKTMKVAEAIELKSTLGFRQSYLATLRTQFTQATQLADKANSDLDKVIETLLTTSYGNDKTKIDSDTVKAITDPQKLQKAVTLLDPCNIQEKIKAAQAEVEVLTSEIDFVLSESNAKTTIEV